MRVVAVARLELHALLSAPVVYVIGALFLIVQGTSFSSLVSAMADPQRPAALAAVLELQLGGTVLGWSLWAMVLALLGMRALAEAQKSGEWEALICAGVSERAAVLGKWLAGSALLALLWLPTMAYLAVIAAYQRGGAAWDLGSIAAGYLGVWAIGAALLAWSLAASAATGHPLLAAALAYLALMVLLLVGELPSIAPELARDAPALARAAAALGLRGHAAALARGEVTAEALVAIAALAGVGLSAAVTLAGRGRRRAADQGARALATGLLAAAAAVAVALAGRSEASWDVSARARNTLDDATLSVLAEVRRPVELVIIEPTLGALQPVFERAEEVLARMRRRQPLLAVRRLDPAVLPGGMAAAARQAGIAERDLAASGAIVVRAGERQRTLDFFELAELTASAAGPELLRWSVERAVAARLAELMRPSPLAVCLTSGHDELPLARPEPAAAGAPALELAALAARLADDGAQLVPLADGPVPPGCDVVLVAGPRRPLPPAMALELAAWVERGGGLVVGLSSRTIDERGQLAGSGLELVLAAAGIEPLAAVAVDPRGAVGSDGSLRVLEGYGEHEIDRGFQRARATVWWTPRALAVQGAAQALVRGSGESWGETDLLAPPVRGPDDVAGPVVLAAAVELDGSAMRTSGAAPTAPTGAGVAPKPAGGRIVVMGSMESLASPVLAAGTSALDLWMARALRWAGRRPLPVVPVADRAPDQVRLLMTRGERRRVAALCAVGIPAAWLGLGLLLGWARRRRGRRDDRAASPSDASGDSSDGPSGGPSDDPSDGPRGGASEGTSGGASDDPSGGSGDRPSGGRP